MIAPKGAEARAPKPPGDELVEKLRLQRPPDEVQQPAVLRKLGDARDGRDFKVAEVPRQQEDALPPRVGGER
jgi:hypothetical protein